MDGQVYLHSYCLMDNHVHQVLSYRGTSDAFSRFMRIAHGIFGKKFNFFHKRSGKVANERPKTSVIQDTIHAMRVHFYIEANPIRAGMRKFENLKLFQYSSYGFYAFGITDFFSKYLTPPKWYLELGDTAKKRQEKYRSLFKKYLDEGSPINLFKRFLGEVAWIAEAEELLKARFKQRPTQKKAVLIELDTS